MKKKKPASIVQQSSAMPSTTIEQGSSGFEPKWQFAVITALTGLLLYANSISHGYVLDDNGIILENLYVQQGLKGLGGIFSSDVWHFQIVNLNYYRPLSLATFAIEHQFFPLNPHVGHLDNVILYALTGFFLCLLLMRVFKQYNPLFALAVSLLFMAHPIHTEVVDNIKSRDEILSFLNLIIAIYILLKSIKTDGSDYKLLGLSCFFFYLALLSKETALIGFILVPVILFFERSFSLKQIAVRTAPFMALVLLFQLQKYLVLGSLTAPALKDLLNYPYTEPGTKLPSMFLLFGWCLKLLFVPFPLSYSYAYNQIPAAVWTSAGAIAGLLLALALVFVVYREMKSKTPVAFGGLLVIVTLAPAMMFVLLRGGIFAERFLYAPVLGFCIVLVWLALKAFKVSAVAQVQKVSGVWIALGVIFCCYSFVTINRNSDWKDQLTLNAHDVEVTPNSCQVHLHYGVVLIEKGVTEKDPVKRNDYFDKGVNQLREAISIDPDIAEEYHEIGIAYQQIKQNYDSALYYYNRAILASPGYAFGYMSLGTLYENTGQDSLASYYYNMGVKLNPYFPQGIAARDNHRKRTGLDVKSFPTANIADSLELNAANKDFNFYNDKGQAYGKSGDFANATRYLQKAVELNPSSTEALINLSLCFAMQKQYDKSIESLNKALLIDPDNKLALNNLAIIYEHTGNAEKAAECRKKASSLP